MNNNTDLQEKSKNFKFIIEFVNNYNINNLDYLSCNSLKYDLFKSYYNILNNYTNVIIGASDDKSGNIKHGGDWILETTNENIKKIYFNDNIDNYTSTLETSIINNSLLLTQSEINNLYFPVSIEGGTSENPIIITLSSDINIPFSDPNGVVYSRGLMYFDIKTEYFIFDGNNYNIHFRTPPHIAGIHSDLSGLFKNGSYDIVDTLDEEYNNVNLYRVWKYYN